MQERVHANMAAPTAPAVPGAGTRAAAWDRLWDLPEHRVFAAGPSFRHKLRLVLSLVHREELAGRALDVGCGTGELLSALPPTMTDLTGVDISARALEQAHQHCGRGRFFKLDIERGSLPETFDVIFCANALEEMEHDEAALRHMASMLTPRGALVIVTPHRRRYWTAKDVLAGNKRRYEREELAAKLQAAGFHDLHLTTWGWPLYRLWYRLMAVVKQEVVWQTPRRAGVARWLAAAAYRALFLDDLFRGSPRGSILIALARKP